MAITKEDILEAVGSLTVMELNDLVKAFEFFGVIVNNFYFILIAVSLSDGLCESVILLIYFENLKHQLGNTFLCIKRKRAV